MGSGSAPATPDHRHLLEQRGWVVFDQDPRMLAWVESALPSARETLVMPENRHWWRHGDTWFVGVNALPNDAGGAVAGGPTLSGPAMDLLACMPPLSALSLDRAQVSVCRPGYPRRAPDQSEANHRYRVERDAAHIDGLLRRGPDNRRYLGEHHGYILGIPMTRFSADAAPFVVWEGSHHVVREVFGRLLGGMPVRRWRDLDLTRDYHDLRRRLFGSHQRREIHAGPGQCFLIHRLALHGMAPWRQGAGSDPVGRMICYFRPELPDPALWLDLP